jgi:hypothetical protein
MRVNVYAEEMTDRVEIVTKETKDGTFTGVRFYLELPVTTDLPVFQRDAAGVYAVCGGNVRGPFIHHPGDDDSAAVTFWGKTELKNALRKALFLLEQEEARDER